MGHAAIPRPQGGMGSAGAARLHEVFGSGTAAVISPVGEWTHSFFDTITPIQDGKLEDPYGWTLPVAT